MNIDLSLGDAVLNLVVSDYLLKRGIRTEGYPPSCEDLLLGTKGSDIAKALRLGEAVHLSHGELENGGRQKPRILSCCFEALVGALYLDQGYMNAHKFVESVVLKDANQIITEHLDEDFKNTLNEYCQRAWKMSPRYEKQRMNLVLIIRRHSW